MFKQPYYDTIIFSATTWKLDNTVSSVKQDVSSNIEFVKDAAFVSNLTKHLKNKAKYYVMVKFILNEEPNEEILKIIQKRNMYNQMTPSVTKHGRPKHELDLRRVFTYIIDKFAKYNFKTYPSFRLLILDDFAGHPLLKAIDSP
jgi:hypothetical protein